MSIVPYSAIEDGENRIIASLPVANSLVLYNSQTKSLEIINNLQEGPAANSRGANGARNSPSGGAHPHSRPVGQAMGAGELRCPNCGFGWNIAEEGTGPSSRSNGDRGGNRATGVANNGTVGVDVGVNDSNNNGRHPSIGSVAGVDATAQMDNDYFKILQVHFQSENNSLINFVGPKFIENEEHRSQYIRLSDTLFTQGYFNKFFKVMKKLGTGSNASVFKVEHCLSNITIGIFALKKIGIGEDAENLDNVLREVQFLYNLTSGELYDNIEEDQTTNSGEDEAYYKDILMSLDGARHLIKYNHVWLEIDNASTFGPKIPCVFILLEYCDGGDLENFINRKFNDTDADTMKMKLLRRKRNKNKQLSKFLNNFEIFKIFKDICLGVYQLHKSHIIHRDLKPSNCLLKQTPSDSLRLKSIHDLDKFPDVVVSDFGESAIEGTARNSSGYTGTLEFASPELLFSKIEGSDTLANFNKSSDIYSLGLILYFLCFNRLPYESGNTDAIKDQIFTYYHSRDTEEFLFGDLNKTRRQTCVSVEDNESLLIDFIDLILRMCDIDPNKRPSIEDIIIFLMTDLWKKLEAHNLKVTRSDSLELAKLVEDDQEEPKTSKPLIAPMVILLIAVPLVYLTKWDWNYCIFFLLGVVMRYSFQ